MGLAGISSGPVVLMRDAAVAATATPPGGAVTADGHVFSGSRTAIAIGPLDNVKLATSIMTRASNRTWEMGVSSEIKAAPAGFGK